MRFRAILGVSLTAALLVLAGPAVQAVAYPPTICPTLSVGTTNPLPGQSIAVSGTNFDPRASIKLQLHSPVQTLKTVTSDASGSFSTSIKLPAGLTGHHTLVAVGGGSTGQANCGADPFQIQSNGGGSSSANPGTNGGGTAFTGFDVLALIAAAVVLVGAGVMLNVSGKRRKYASRH